MNRVREGEVAEVVLGYQIFLEQLIGLRQRMAHVDHVEMPDVRAVDRVQLRAERIVPTECPGIGPVVGLAPEVERPGIQIDPVFLAGDLAGGEIVEIVDPAGQARVVVGPAIPRLQRRHQVRITVLLSQAHQQGTIELSRIHMLQRLAIAPFPVLGQVAEQLAGPAHAAFEEGESKVREAPGHPTQEDRLGDRVAGGREMPDVVVDEVGWRQPQALIAARAVEGRGDAELLALRPDRIVVVVTVESQHVVPDRETRRIWIGRRDRRNAPRHAAAEHAHLRPELPRDEFKLRDGLRSEEHTSELQSRSDLVCRLLLEKKKKQTIYTQTDKKKQYMNTLEQD